jgi:hypothetical protein
VYRRYSSALVKSSSSPNSSSVSRISTDPKLLCCGTSQLLQHLSSLDTGTVRRWHVHHDRQRIFDSLLRDRQIYTTRSSAEAGVIHTMVYGTVRGCHFKDHDERERSLRFPSTS